MYIQGGQFPFALDFAETEVVQLPLEAREVRMSEVDGHFSFERDRIMNIELAARPGDEVRRLVADHGQELDEEVRGGGAAAVYCAAHAYRARVWRRGFQVAASRVFRRVRACR